MTTGEEPKKSTKEEAKRSFLHPDGAERRSFIQKRSCDLYTIRLEADPDADWIACVSMARKEWDEKHSDSLDGPQENP